MATTTPDVRYDEWYEHKLAPGEEQTLASWHWQAIAFLPNLDGLRVLDIGTGVGCFARYLAEHGAAEVVAADFSQAAIEYGRQKVFGHLPNVTPAIEDVLDISYPDASFDLTACCSTIEHVRDPKKALSELVRVTKPEGTIIIAMPNYMSLTGLYRLGWKLKGKEFREIGQPINHPLMLPVVMWRLKRLGCRITGVDGEYHMLYWPFAEGRHIILHFLERGRLRRFSKWFGLHALIRATRLPDR